MSFDEIISQDKLRKELYCLGQIIRTYLFQREGVGETGEESLEELLYLYSEKVMVEIEQEE